MKKEKITITYEIGYDEFGIPVVVLKNNKIIFKLYDIVSVSGNSKKSIFPGIPGIQKPAFGKILEILKSEDDLFFGILTFNNHYGYVTIERIKKIE